MRHSMFVAIGLLCWWSASAYADNRPDNHPGRQVYESYEAAVKTASSERKRLAVRWSRVKDRAAYRRQVEGIIISQVRGLANHWLGTRWGLGAPQARKPGPGKINCGTFVGTILRDAGFELNVKKLQRQPSQLIIKSFVKGKRVRKYSNASMSKFLASVREMGPGLYIIGLDFHVGFLVQTATDLRFIHASYVTQTVVDERASIAIPIVTSKYRVVGKILSAANIDSWLKRSRINVRGNW